MSRSPRLAARAVITHENRLLLVNAWSAAKGSDLWCAPGGGVERGQSIPDNLARELQEECGLAISVGPPCLINEFHDPAGDFHQVEIFFRCSVVSDNLPENWRDPEGVVDQRRWFSQADLAQIRLKPSSLPQIAFTPQSALFYDALEPIQQ